MDSVAESELAVGGEIAAASRVNDIWRLHHDAVLCTYHLRRFNGDAAIEVMRTHPMVIGGGILRRTPICLTAEQFVPEFPERRAKRSRRITEV
jgi:hypothetical protein